MKTGADLAGFQFSIEIDGVLFTDFLEGDPLAGISQVLNMDVAGGAGNVVGVDVSGEAVIPALFVGLLTRLVRTDNDPTPLPTGDLCTFDFVMADVNAQPVGGFSDCTPEEVCLVGVSPPSPPGAMLPPPGQVQQSPPPPEMAAFPPPTPGLVGCQDFCGGQSPDGCFCDALCLVFSDCCPDTTEFCPQPSPPPAAPATCVGFCGGASAGGCFCDDLCTLFADCCPDKTDICDVSPPPPTASPPPSPSPMGSVISDPHFVGLQNQTYDVTGITGHIYSIIADEDMYINSRFETAFTSGVYLDPSSNIVKNYRPRGTWMADIGVVLGDADNEATIIVSKEPPAVDVEACADKPQDCFFGGVGGSVTIDGESVVQVGTIQVNDDVTVKVANLKRFSRVSITSSHVKMDLDYVPAPSEWEIGDSEERAEYGHLNLKVHEIYVTSHINGVLGASARMKYDEEGMPILKALDKDGKGVLDGNVESYEVPSLLSKYALYQAEGEHEASDVIPVLAWKVQEEPEVAEANPWLAAWPSIIKQLHINSLYTTHARIGHSKASRRIHVAGGSETRQPLGLALGPWQVQICHVECSTPPRKGHSGPMIG
eukprot:scaffold7404_cov363-Prasinococcus_capsulatus_cf.AAC.4